MTVIFFLLTAEKTYRQVVFVFYRTALAARTNTGEKRRWMGGGGGGRPGDEKGRLGVGGGEGIRSPVDRNPLETFITMPREKMIYWSKSELQRAATIKACLQISLNSHGKECVNTARLHTDKTQRRRERRGRKGGGGRRRRREGGEGEGGGEVVDGRKS